MIMKLMMKMMNMKMFSWPFRILGNKFDRLYCKELRDLSSDYLEGTLPDSAQEKIRGHLSWCPRCSAFVNTLRDTISRLKTLPFHKAPPSFRQRLLERLKSEGDK